MPQAEDKAFKGRWWNLDFRIKDTEWEKITNNLVAHRKDENEIEVQNGI